ncbi:protein AHNAK2 [Talpa occidentalis]|uniref:protein AHNAK2 n=1 Tax=Talpa occidentalis TaxID=50954 RepID=UPI001890627A|nr:protein AHNAK2 [Talpa occidentalis]
MCDCFHVVLPAWAGAPGSGRSRPSPLSPPPALGRGACLGPGGGHRGGQHVWLDPGGLPHGLASDLLGGQWLTGPGAKVLWNVKPLYAERERLASPPPSPPGLAPGLPEWTLLASGSKGRVDTAGAWVVSGSAPLGGARLLRAEPAPEASGDPSLGGRGGVEKGVLPSRGAGLDAGTGGEAAARPRQGPSCAPYGTSRGLKGLPGGLGHSHRGQSRPGGTGRQLQPEEPDVEAEEDRSVTARELVRPQPQGSSPVYECVAEGAGSGLPDAPEVTLETKAEAGASGYSVAGGGSRGVFVKHVLKGSSAAKLFNLREGDQLLSATIFFDDIKYEDALKILQYSEPYRVQFQIRRKLPARQDEAQLSRGTQQGPAGTKKQLQVAPDGPPGTPAKTLEADSDQDRLLGRPDRARGRQPQKERLSWPKFQPGKGSRQLGPRRSRSSSEAQELSPTHPCSEAPLPDTHPQVDATGHMRGSHPDRPQSEAPKIKEAKDGAGEAEGGWAAPAAGKMPQSEGAAQVGAREWGHVVRGLADEASTDSKVSIIRLKMPSFGVWTEQQSREGAEEEHKSSHGERAEHGHQHRHKKQTAQDLSIQPPLAEVEDPTVQVAVKLPEGHVPEGDFAQAEMTAGLKGHLPKVKTGRLKMPKVELKAPQLDVKGPSMDLEGPKMTVSCPDVDMSMARTQVDIQARGNLLEGDLGLGDTEVTSRDSKFKMPKFKMPSFGVSAPGKTEKASVEVDASLPQGQADVSWPPMQGGINAPDVNIKLLSAKVDDPTVQEAMKQPEGHVPKGNFTQPEMGAGHKGHLPKVKTGSLKMPKVDFKVPQVDIKVPSVDLEGPKVTVSCPKVDVSMASTEVDIQAPGVSLEGDVGLGDKEGISRDSKFKMPKFKMPSFGMSASGKTGKASVEVDTSLPKVQTDISLPSIKGVVTNPDLTIKLPSAEMEDSTVQVTVKLPEGYVPKGDFTQPEMGAGLKGHLPKVKTDSLKIAKVDLKAPKLDVQGASVDLESPKVMSSCPDMDVSMASSQVDIQAPRVSLRGDLGLGDMEVTSRDSKFKMPKFKVPSFGVSTPGKSGKASVEVDVSLPQGQADISWQGGNKAPDLSIKLPSAKMDNQTIQVDVKLPKGQVPEGDFSQLEMGAGLEGHLPKVKTGSLKMPKVDLKAPELDIKGTSVDLEGPKVTVSCPEVDLSMASSEVDIQEPGVSLEGDVGLGDAEVTPRDSKFKMPKFKMPSFGVSTPGKSGKASVEVDTSLPKVQADISLPSFKGDVRAPDLSIKPPSAEVDVPTVQVAVKLPEGHVPEGDFAQPEMGTGLKGHLPKVKTGSLKMPKVDLKAPELDIKGASVDLESPKVMISCPTEDVSMASSQVDIQAPGVSLEGDVSLGDAEVTPRDSKFKMPRFKMPSFGVSIPGKSGKASVEVDTSLPKVQADISLPSFKGDVKAPDLSIKPPLAEVDVPTVQVAVKLPEGHVPEGDFAQPEMGAGLKGHLPKVKTSSLKMPKVDLKAPELDIKGTSVDLESPKVMVSFPEVDVSVASSEVDIQAPGVSLEGDMGLVDAEVTSRDSKFKMPKFKMPSFSVSGPEKTGKASVEVDVSLPKDQADISLPSFKGDIKAPDLSIKQPSDKVDVPTVQVAVKLPEGHVPEGDVAQPEMGAGLKGHLPKVKTGSLKMPKVDLKAPELDIKGTSVDMEGPKVTVSCPEVDVSLASSLVDIQAPGVSLEGDVGLGDAEVTPRDSKFKMPKFKMPSFGVSTPGKSGKASVEVDTSLPKVQADISLPSFKGDVKAPDLNIKPPLAEMNVPTVQVAVKLPEGHVPKGDFAQPEMGAELKGHLPKVKTGSLKMPKVDLKAPKLDIKGVSVDLEGPKVMVCFPEVDVSVASSQVDIQAPGVSLEGDVGLVDAEVTSRDSKFKMPKLKMPSFGVSTPGMFEKDSVKVDTSLPKFQADISLPSFKGDVQAPDLSIKPPSTEVDVPTVQVAVKLPEGHVPKGDFAQPEMDAGLKGHLPKVKTGSLKMPKVDLKAPKLDIKGMSVDLEGPKVTVSCPDVDVSMASSQEDIQAMGVLLERDLGLGVTEVTSRDSKFTMPKFKMPSFEVSTPGKTGKASVKVDASLPHGQGNVSLPSMQGDVSIKLPSAEVDVATVQVAGKLSEGPVPEGDFAQPEMGTGLKGHLPKVKTGSLKMPKVDFQVPQSGIKGLSVDLERPKVTVSCPEVDVPMTSTQVDTQALGVSLEGKVGLGDAEVTSRDSKFKMPKLKTPSFSLSGPGKTGKASIEVDASLPQGQADVSWPSIQEGVKAQDLSIKLPSAEVDIPTIQVTMKLPEGHVPEGDFAQPVMGAGLKGHLPKVKTGSLKMPKMDLKAPELDIKGASVDLEGPKVTVSCPEVDVSMASSQVDIQAPGVSLEADVGLGDAEVTSRDSKFKMPKFKMPSFGVSTPGKSGKASVEVDASLPQGHADILLPSLKGEVKAPDFSIKLPSAEMDVLSVQVDAKQPKGQVPEGDFTQPEMGAGLKGHLLKVKTGSLKIPKVDFKAGQSDINGPSVDLEGPKVTVSGPEEDVSMASSQGDIQAPGVSLERDLGLGDTEVTSRDSKFKMPKFKMPSFSVSAPGKSRKALVKVDASLPHGQADVSLPSTQGDISNKLPSAEVDILTVQVDVKLPEVPVPEGDFTQPEMGTGLKGHLPKVKTGSLKMPKMDLRAPQLDVKSPSVDLEGPKMTVICSDVSMASTQVDIQAPGVSLEGDVGLGDAEVTLRDSKFKMPKFKMPSFGVSGLGKSGKASVEVDASLPKVQRDVLLPSIKGEVKAPDLSIKLPEAEMDNPTVQVDVKLPEVQGPEGDFSQLEMGAGLKGHLPKVKTGSLKMPKVDLKAPELDIKGASVDLEGPKVTVSCPEVDVSMASSEVDIQAPGVSLEGDVGLGDAEVTPRDSKFKMPKFKMPSFGVSTPGKSGKASVEVDTSLPKVQADISLPSFKGDVKAPDLSIKLPSAEVDVPTVQVAVKLPEGHVPEGDFAQPEMGAGLKGHLPKVKTGSLKMPKVDFQLPQSDIKGPSVDLEGPKVTVSCPEVDVSMASTEVDIQAPGVSLEGDVGLGDAEVTPRDSKFKMPKFKMPSFGVSTPGKSGKASVEVDTSLPKVQADISLLSFKGDVKAPDLSIKPPSAEVDVPTVQVAVKLPEGHVPEGDFAQPEMGAGLKGHLPKVKTSSLKMPKVDLKAPELDIKGVSVDLEGPKVMVSFPEVDMSVASSQVDIQAPGVSLEGDVGLGITEGTSRDSKFKMPKFKMPSFGVSAPGKTGKASGEVDASLPLGQADVSLPSMQGDVSIKLPSAKVDVPTVQVAGKLSEGPVPEGDFAQPEMGTGLKGHLPKVKTGSLKMPKVDFQVPQSDIKGPSVDLEGPKVMVSCPDVDVSMASTEVDIQAPGVSLEGDVGLGDAEVTSRDSKFKMPKLKMPSFGVSSSGKSRKASVQVDASLPQGHADISLPSFKGDIKAPDLSIKLPSSKVDVLTVQVAVKLPEGHVPEGDVTQPEMGAGLKGHLPEVKTGSLKMPKVDFKAGQLDIKDPSVDLEGPKVTVSYPNMDVSMASSQVDIQAPGISLEGDMGLGDMEVTSRDSKFKMPKFKMPSFGVSGPGKTGKASVEVDTSLPHGQAEVSLPSMQGDISISLSSAEVYVPTVQVAMKLPEGHVPEGDFTQPKTRGGLKGHLPKVKTDSFKMPKVDFKSPQLDIKGASVDLECSKVTVSGPDMDMSMASSRVDIQAPGVSLEGDLGLGDTEVTSRDSKFKMPKLKMPSFGVSGLGKSAKPLVEMDASLPQGQADVSLTSIKGDVKAPDVSFQLPLAEVDLPTVQVGLRLPTGAGGLGDVGSTAREAVPPTGEDLPAPDICGSGAAGPDLPLLQTRPSTGLREVSSASKAVGGRRSSADPLLPCGWPGDAVTTPMDSPERPVPVEESRADSRDSWFQMPSFRLPGLRRGSSTGPAGSGAQGEAQGPLPAEVAARAGDAPAGAAAGSQGICAVGRRPAPEAAAEKASYADVLRRPADSTGPPERLPPAGVSAAEVRAGEGEGPILQLPPIPCCAGSPGPRGEPGEGVPFPQLRAPGLTCPAPRPRSVVSVPEVRPTRGPDGHVDVTLWQDSPGGRGASPPKAGAGFPAQQPVDPDLPSDASGSSGSSVRAQVRAAWGWSPALPSPDHSPPAAGPCVVRGALIPASPLQTPSYGFSLLKGKIPEPPPRAGLGVGPPDAGPGAAVQDASSGPAAVRPDPGEPLEVIACGPEEPALPPPRPEFRPGLPGADSCSEEEPAEVLATPAGDSVGAGGPGGPGPAGAGGEWETCRPAQALVPQLGLQLYGGVRCRLRGAGRGALQHRHRRGHPKGRSGGAGSGSQAGLLLHAEQEEQERPRGRGRAKPPEETVAFFDARECFSRGGGGGGGARVGRPWWPPQPERS